MITVPARPTPATLKPPPDVYTLMAATQLHREGKLIAPSSSVSTPEPIPLPPRSTK